MIDGHAHVGVQLDPPIYATIAIAGLRGFPGVAGGIESHCEQLYLRLSQLSPEIRIVVLARRGYLDEDLHATSNLHVTPIWCWKNKYMESITHTGLAVLVARFGIGAKMIHLHGIGPALLAPLARLLGMRVVVTHHGADYRRQKWNKLAKLILRLGEWAAAQFANSVIVVGASEHNELRSRFPSFAGKFRNIPNGARLDMRDLVSSRSERDRHLGQFGLEAGDYILAVGRLVPEKGFHDLIDAHATSGTTKKLVIVGDSDHRDRYYNELSSRGSDRVLFTGFQKGEALASLYSGASLFVLPSYHEGLPIVALEAMSFGLPLLLSDITPNKDIGLASRCYFPVGDISSLSAKLAVSDYAVYQPNSDDALNRYDWETIASQTLGVYEAVLVGTDYTR